MQCDPSVILESNIASSEEQAPGIYQRPYHPQSVVWNLDDSVAPRRAEEEIRLLHLLEVLPLWRGITTHSVANQEDQDFKFLPALS
jgi:hypothetical protein